MATDACYELLQVAVGSREVLSRTLSDEEWEGLLTASRKQAVEGVMLVGVQRLPAAQKPPQRLLLQWIGEVAAIRQKNRLLYQRCVDVTRLFADAGFRSCILKGQGNALMYADPLSRTPGDIDIWLEGSRKEIRDFVLSKCPRAHDGDMHISFPYYKDVIVEVHYKPRYSVVPRFDRRIQAWFTLHAAEQFAHQVSLPGMDDAAFCVPTPHFNVVHQMTHIMGHFLNEGIGLRQFVDYYYVLQKAHESGAADGCGEVFAQLGMLKFARGVMWVEREVLGLDEGCLPVEPDEKTGRWMLNEIEEGGNFGSYDERYKGRKKGLLIRGATDSFRLLKMVHRFPEEALWRILRKVENQKWRIRRLFAKRTMR